MTYELDGDLFVGSDVGAVVDVTEGAAAQLAGQSVLSADS